jgi:hypothetical protein
MDFWDFKPWYPKNISHPDHPKKKLKKKKSLATETKDFEEFIFNKKLPDLDNRVPACCQKSGIKGFLNCFLLAK